MMVFLPHYFPVHRRERIMFIKYFLVMSCVFLGGCVNLRSGDQFEQISLNTHYSQKEKAAIEKMNAVGWQLAIERAPISGFYNTNQVAVVTGGYEYSYAKGIRWIDRLPNLLQDTIIQVLDKTHKIEGVGYPAMGLNVKYRLILGLEKFQIFLDEKRKEQKAEIVLSIKLFDLKEMKIIDKKLFSAKSIIVNNQLKNIAKAFNKAFSQVMFSLVQWVLSH